LIEWAAQRARPAGVLAEQRPPPTGEPVCVSPRTWSHPAYVRAVRECLDRTTELNRCPACGHATPRPSRLTDRLAAVSDQ